MPPTEPEKLFYFCDAETAAEACKSGTLSWITPFDFDGITELNHKSTLRFDKTQLTQSAVRVACSLIFGPDDPKGESPLLNAIKRWRDSERFATPDEAKEVLKELSTKLVDQRFDDITQSMTRWRSACSAFQILRLFENVDNFHTWYHYGQQFRGIALALKTGEGSTIEQAKRVQYVDKVPEVTTLKEQVSALLYELKPHPETTLEKKFIQRAMTFKAEKEWRYFHINTDTSETERPVAQVSAIYFGPGATEEDKDCVLSEAHNMEEKPKVFQSHFTKGKFDLTHDNLIL